MNGVFRGGVPYQVDVNRLKEAFPVPNLTEGLVIKHEQLEAIVQARAKTGRYYGVVDSWKAEMKNANGIIIEWQPSIGVKVLNPAEVLASAETGVKRKIGQTGRAIKKFAWVDRNRLDQIGQKRLDHQVRVTGAIRDALASAKKELAVELAPVKSLPKPTLVKEA